MGGIEVPVHDIERPSPGQPRGKLGSGRLRLTSYGVLQLAGDGHYIGIPTSRIDDKSKFDVIEKILVATQMAWVAIQCIVRKAYGLPLSLLEIHCMVHVACAVTLFFLWIHVRLTRWPATHVLRILTPQVLDRSRRMFKTQRFYISLDLKTL